MHAIMINDAIGLTHFIQQGTETMDTNKKHKCLNKEASAMKYYLSSLGSSAEEAFFRAGPRKYRILAVHHHVAIFFDPKGHSPETGRRKSRSATTCPLNANGARRRALFVGLHR